MKTTPLVSLSLLSITLSSISGFAAPIDTLIQKLDYKKLINEETRKTPPIVNSLTQAEAIEDFTAMAYGLKYGYIGYDNQAKTFNWDNYFASTLAKIKTKKKWPIKDFFNLTGSLTDQINDGHLTVFIAPNTWYTGKNQQWRAYIAVDASQQNEITKKDCQITNQQNILENQNFLLSQNLYKASVVLSLPEVKSITCSTKEIKLREITSQNQPLPEFDEIPLNDGGYYVRMSSFAKTSLENNKDFIASAENAKKAKNVILDLRGNSGGDPIFFAKWLSALKIGQNIEIWPTITSMVSFANIISNYNTTFLIGSQMKDIGADSETLAQIGESLKNLQSQLKYGFQTKQFTSKKYVTHHSESLQATDKEFEGEIYVLVDSNCFSACELAVHTANELKGVHVVGTNTGGVNTYGNATEFKLPHSGLYVAIPSNIMMNIGANGTSAEGTGLPPDLWVEGDSLPTVLNYLHFKSIAKK